MIRLKDDNQIWQIRNEAQIAAKNAAYQLTGQPLNDALAHIIADAVQAGISKMLELQYTDDDFERDMNLKT